MKALLLSLGVLLSHTALGVGLNHVDLDSQPSPGLLKAQLGMSAQPFDGTPRGGLRSAPGAYSGFAMVDGMYLRTFVRIGPEGRVQMIRVTFNPMPYWDQLEDFMIGRLGKPTTSGHIVQTTALGVRVDNIEHDWVGEDHAMVSLLKYIDLSTGSLSLETEAYIMATRGPGAVVPVPQ